MNINKISKYTIINYFYYLNDLRKIKKDRGYMKNQANTYLDAALYLLSVIQKNAKKITTENDYHKALELSENSAALAVAVDTLINKSNQLKEMAEK